MTATGLICPGEGEIDEKTNSFSAKFTIIETNMLHGSRATIVVISCGRTIDDQI